MKKHITLAAMAALMLFSMSSSISSTAVFGKGHFGNGQPKESAVQSEVSSKLINHRLRLMGTPLRSYGLSHAYEAEVGLALKISVKILEHHSIGEIDDCETKYNETMDLHNEGIDLLQVVGKGLDAGNNSCDVLKQSMKGLNQSEKKFKKCWEVVKEGIQACVNTPNIDAIVEAGNSCENQLKVVEKFRTELKRRMDLACK